MQRIQRKRTKGWRMPEGAVYVGRPTLWGNPFHWQTALEVGYAAGDKAEARRVAAEAFADWLFRGPNSHWWIACPKTIDRWHWMRDHIGELRGRTLVCWCRLDVPCHADALLAFANADSARY